MDMQSPDFQAGYKNGYAAAMQQALRQHLQSERETIRPSAPKHNENSAEATDPFVDPYFIAQVYADHREGMTKATAGQETTT